MLEPLRFDRFEEDRQVRGGRWAASWTWTTRPLDHTSALDHKPSQAKPNRTAPTRGLVVQSFILKESWNNPGLDSLFPPMILYDISPQGSPPSRVLDTLSTRNQYFRQSIGLLIFFSSDSTSCGQRRLVVQRSPSSAASQYVQKSVGKISSAGSAGANLSQTEQDATGGRQRKREPSDRGLAPRILFRGKRVMQLPRAILGMAMVMARPSDGRAKLSTGPRLVPSNIKNMIHSGWRRQREGTRNRSFTP